MTEAQAVIMAAFVAAASALWVGWLNWRALREQNRISAFEKRLAVFKDAQIALGSVLRYADADADAISSITKAVQASWFLFPRALSDRLTVMRNQMIDLNTAVEMMRQTPPSPDHAEHVKLKHKNLKALIAELEGLAELFKPHVSLHAEEDSRHPFAWLDDLLDSLEKR